MDHIDQAFGALSRRINGLPAPDYRPSTPETLVSLIAKVNRANSRYDPAARR